MTEKLKSYLDGLFATVPYTDEVKEAKDELYDSMVERYEDCIREGMDEQAAYDCVIDSIGNIHELFDELDFGEKAGGKDESRFQKAGEQVASELGEFVRSVTDFAGGLVTGLFGEPEAGDLKLVNTISLAAQDMRFITVDYVSESINMHYSEDDNLVVNEYMNREDSTLYADAVLSGGGVTIRHGRRGGLFGLRSRIDVFIPKSWQGAFSLATTSGRILVPDVWSFSSFAAKSVSGDVELGEITASIIKAGSTSGSVVITKATGEVDLHSVSGNIRVDTIDGCGQAGTTSGGIRAGFSTLTGPVRLSSVSGGVRLGLPQDVSFELDASSISGSIHTAFDSFLTYQKRNRAHGFVGDAPYHNIKINTTSGGIHIND